MSIGLVFLMSLACVAACLFTLGRVIGWRNILRYATAIDVVFTICLGIILAGTLTGILIAIVAGLIMAGVLTVAKSLHSGASKLRSRPKMAAPDVYECADDWAPKYGWGKL